MPSPEEKKLQALQKSKQLMLDNLSILKQTEAAHRQEYEAARKYIDEMESYYQIMSEAEKKAFDARKKMIKDYEKTLQGVESVTKGIEENTKQTTKATAEIERQRKSFEKLRKETKGMVNDQSDIIKGLRKMNESFKGTSKTQKEINTGFAGLELALKNVNKTIGDGKKLHEDELKEVQKFKKAYNDYATSIADVQRQVAEKNMTEEQAIEVIKRQRESFNDITKELKFTTKEGIKVKEQIQGMGGYADEFGKKMEGVNKKVGDIKSGFDELKGQLGSMVPMGKELLDVFSKFGKVGFAGAMAALGAAAGKFLNESGLLKKALPGIKDRLDVEQEGKRRTFNTVTQPLQVKEFEIDQKYAKEEFKIDQKYEKQRHALTMGNKQAEAAMTFKSEASMAYFGKALPNLGFAANQLQNAGISADVIANASTTIAAKMGVGGKESAVLGAEMATFSKFAGIGAEEATNISESFRLIEGVSAETAGNMMQGVKAMAEQLDLNPGAVMKEMANASEIALEMNINSGKALAKQVAYASSIGVSFSKVSKAGQNMVLNYKDSIKAEMQLSSLLGEQVDLSEVRASFAAGDTEGAMKALQAQGLDPSKMDLFQKQALQQATGMDLEELTKINKGGGKSEQALDAAATKIDNASMHAANKHLLAAETARQIALDNNQFALQQEEAKKAFDLEQKKAREDFELRLKKDRESFEADLSFDRIRQDNELALQMNNLQNTILTELIPALFMFGASGGISAVTDLVGMFSKKGKGGKNRTRTGRQSSAQRRSSATQSTPRTTAPASSTPATPPTRAQQVAQLKAQNPGMTSQQALQQIKSTPGGSTPKPAAPSGAAPKIPSAPKIPPASPPPAPKMGFMDKLNPKKFLGNVVGKSGGILKVLGSVAGKVAGPLGTVLSGLSLFSDLKAMVTMNEGSMPDLYKNVGGSVIGLVGSILGGAVGGTFLGPIGAMLGSSLGSTVFGWLSDLFPGIPTYLGQFLVDTLGIFGKPGSAVPSTGTGGGTSAPTAKDATSKASAIVGTSMAIGQAFKPTAAPTAGGGGAPKSISAPSGSAKVSSPGATGTSTKMSALAGGMTGMLTSVELQKIFNPVNSKTEGFIDQAKSDSAKQTTAIIDQTKAITQTKGLPTQDLLLQQQMNDLLKLMSSVYGGEENKKIELMIDGKKVTTVIKKREDNNKGQDKGDGEP